MLFASSANDFALLFVSLELITVTFYVLTSFQRARVTSLEAGVKYLIIGALSTAFTVYGIALVYGISHTLNFGLLSGVAAQFGDNKIFLFGLALERAQVLVVLEYKELGGLVCPRERVPPALDKRDCGRQRRPPAVDLGEVLARPRRHVARDVAGAAPLEIQRVRAGEGLQIGQRCGIRRHVPVSGQARERDAVGAVRDGPLQRLQRRQIEREEPVVVEPDTAAGRRSWRAHRMVTIAQSISTMTPTRPQVPKKPAKSLQAGLRISQFRPRKSLS